MQHVFIIGSKGIPGAYGGYETFVDKLVEYHRNKTEIKYHVACKGKRNEEVEYNNARCFKIKVPNIGAAQAIYYDITALQKCYIYIKENDIKNPIVYILACRIGPYMKYFKNKIHKLGGKLFVNPDGHEWMRAKWNVLIRKYWKISEKMMIKNSDLMICDSKNIKKYIDIKYKKYNPNTIYISYGAEVKKSLKEDNEQKVLEWYKDKKLSSKSYYLAVGRFVPENNYETMIREFMKSKSKKDFVLITNVNNKFLKRIKKKTRFDSDKRIKFVGTVYDTKLLMEIRRNAYGYLHGHEVGGTNPSLLEALGSTDLNLLLNVEFNKEVGEDGALYWTKDDRSLAELIELADGMTDEEIRELRQKARKKIVDKYSWHLIADAYEKVFLKTDY
ncbi:beta 1-4 rhamnosyltransferase Cps2T [Eubacterium limosum]|uniref:beta 1-4 rhamnosyltransferase Cps2T n=1 Tax=Eubacterium limosum TaxID=1736 RepID=UPI001063B6AA|nr:DUF1972 domain-containing protein [Eubacterium limosum]